MTSNVKRLRDYWRNPWDGKNLPQDYISDEAIARSQYLAMIMSRFCPDRGARVLEVGAGVGRNLHHLKEAGYTELTGIELSPVYLKAMAEWYPAVTESVIQGEAHEVLESLAGHFDFIYTMAVLEHIPGPRILDLVAEKADRILTLEDEKTRSWRHIPRNYRHEFESRGFRQIKGWSNLGNGFPHMFVARVFSRWI